MENEEKPIKAVANKQFTEEEYEELKRVIENTYLVEIKELKDKVKRLEETLLKVAQEIDKYVSDDDCDECEDANCVCKQNTSENEISDLEIPVLERQEENYSKPVEDMNLSVCKVVEDKQEDEEKA